MGGIRFRTTSIQKNANRMTNKKDVVVLSVNLRRIFSLQTLSVRLFGSVKLQSLF
jgi:hypothetical protein